MTGWIDSSARKTPQQALHIAFCVDDRFVPRMGATIASIAANNPGGGIVSHVFACSLSDASRSGIAQLEQRFGVSVMIHAIDPAHFRGFDRFIKSSTYSSAIFTRLVVPKLIAGVAERVLYLDADILCVGSVDALRSLNLDGNIVAAVPDAPVTMERRIRALKMRGPLYFNSGVMLIDVHAWNAAGISESVAEVLSGEHKDLRFPDQDALNLALDGRVLFIADKWNHIHGLIGDLDRNQLQLRLKGNPVFIHFAGSVKPWSEWTRHEASELFRFYHRMSPWAEAALEGAPQNYKEMRMYSRFLARRREYGQSLAWYLRYLAARRRHMRGAG